MWRYMLLLVLAVAGCSNGGAHHDAFGRLIPPKSTVERWPTAWCTAHVGMKRSDLRALMGPPVEAQADSDKWQAYQFNLIAFYNVDDTVRQLDADAGTVPCASSRAQ